MLKSGIRNDVYFRNDYKSKLFLFFPAGHFRFSNVSGTFPFFTMLAASHNAKAVEVGYSPHKFL